MLTGSVEVAVANASISTGQTGLFEGFRSALVTEQGVRPIIWPDSFPGKGSMLGKFRSSIDCFAQRALVGLFKSADIDSQLKLCKSSAPLPGSDPSRMLRKLHQRRFFLAAIVHK
jgi:hypothetical protein